MVTHAPFYRIVPGGQLNFMCPPGHPNHTQHIEEFNGPRGRTVQGSYGLDTVLREDHFSEALKRRVQAIFDKAEMVESEMWVRSVYSYFRTMYVPESGDRNVNGLISYKPVNEVRAAASKALYDAKFPRYKSRMNPEPNRGFEVLVAKDASLVFVYHYESGERKDGAVELLDYMEALLAAGFVDVVAQAATEDHNTRMTARPPVVPVAMDPERHAAVACIREYFPGHQPRLDLIEDARKRYGNYPCTKCGKPVQYEAKFDALAVVTTRVDGSGMTHWTYTTECSAGGKHEVDQ